MPLESVYVLVRVKPTFEQTVGDALSKLEACDEIHPLFGEYDFIVRIKGNDHQDIARTILEKVRGLEGVASTKTLVKTSF